MTQQLQDQIRNSADAYGQRVALRLDEGLDGMPYDLSERLRAARTRALAHRKVVAQPRLVMAASASGNGVLSMGGGDDKGSIWRALASVLPLLALVAALFAMNASLDDDRANEVAEVDAALLTDDLPPAAYADPGFLQFLKRAEAAEPAQ
jgi:uncharacterized protein DUF3619